MVRDGAMSRRRPAIVVYRGRDGRGPIRLYLEDGTPLPKVFHVSVQSDQNSIGTVTAEFLADVVIATKRPRRTQ